MNNQDLDALYGQPDRGEYRPGDTITFDEGGQELTGDVLHVAGPQETVRGRHLPTSYTVDAGDGFPHVVLSSQIKGGK